MRKEVVEFAKTIHADTTLDEMQNICRNTEELQYVLNALEKLELEKRAVILPLRLRKQAKKAFENVPTEEITTQTVQIKLLVGYHTAYSVQEWLKKTRGK